MNKSLSFVLRAVRVDNWGASKIPPLLAVGYALILINGVELSVSFLALFVFFACICSVAAYGHIINDIFDIQQDLAIGKKNSMAGLLPVQRYCLCFLFIVTGFVPLIYFNLNLTLTIILMVNYLLPTIYSVPITRLKERGFIGVITDASGAHLMPTLFIALLFIHAGNGTEKTGLAITISASIWALFAGLRGIIAHQISDQRNDRKMNTITFVSSRRRKSLRSLVLKVFFPCEVIGLTLFLYILIPVSIVLAVVTFLYVIVEITKIKCGWKLPLFFPEHPLTEPYLPLLNNEFYEVWLPCALLCQLVFIDYYYVIIMLFHLILFKTIILERLAIFMRLVYDLRKKFKPDLSD